MFVTGRRISVILWLSNEAVEIFVAYDVDLKFTVCCIHFLDVTEGSVGVSRSTFGSRVFWENMEVRDREQRQVRIVQKDQRQPSLREVRSFKNVPM